MDLNFNRRLIFFSPSSPIPSGGIKQIYRNVKLLKDLGLNVILVLDNPGKYNESWLINDHNIITNYNPSLFLKLSMSGLNKKNLFQSLVIKFKSLVKSFLVDSSTLWQVRKDDLLIIPEIWTKNFVGVFPNNDIIIFNQNCFYTVNNYALIENLKAVVTVSNYSNSFLQLIYHRDMVNQISLGIDTDTFSFERKKKKIISYMSRKRPGDIEQIIFLAKLHQDFNEWEFINISNFTELEVAKNLKKSMIFLSTSDSEGFGLPPAEAMACGCVVIGYDGGGGREFLNKGLSFHIQSGDILEYYNCLKKVVVDLNIDFNSYEELRKSASDFIIKNYSLETEKISVQKTWLKILSKM